VDLGRRDRGAGSRAHGREREEIKKEEIDRVKQGKRMSLIDFLPYLKLYSSSFHLTPS